LAAIKSCSFELLRHTPHSPDLAPRDYLCLRLKEYSRCKFTKDNGWKMKNNSLYTMGSVLLRNA